MVPREGFEPPTCGIEAHRSNPLSYRGRYRINVLSVSIGPTCGIEAHRSNPSSATRAGTKTVNGAGGGNRTLISSLEG